MKALDFIISNIGEKVYLTYGMDLAIHGELRKFMSWNHQDPQMFLTIIKLTRGGLAYLLGDDKEYYAVPATSVRLRDYVYDISGKHCPHCNSNRLNYYSEAKDFLCLDCNNLWIPIYEI
jgi:hypothetical protein